MERAAEVGGSGVSELDAIYVLDSMRKLRKSQPEVFGKLGHNFLLNPPLTDAAVSEFEARHRIHLPENYRNFITHIGNGGAGPYYGVFRLGEMDGTFSEAQTWKEGDLFGGKLSEPFPYTEARNEKLEYPPEELERTDENEYERQLDESERKYWAAHPMHGSIPICHEGCAIRIWLVVNGPEAGHLWEDDRANDGGIRPVLLSDGSRTTFSAWYREWLETALASPPGSQHSSPGKLSVFRRCWRRLMGR